MQELHRFGTIQLLVTLASLRNSGYFVGVVPFHCVTDVLAIYLFFNWIQTTIKMTITLKKKKVFLIIRLCTL